MEHLDRNTIQFLPSRRKLLPEEQHKKRRVRRRIEDLLEQQALINDMQWWKNENQSS